MLLKLQLLRINLSPLLPDQTRFKLQIFPSCKRKEVSPDTSFDKCKHTELHSLLPSTQWGSRHATSMSDSSREYHHMVEFTITPSLKRVLYRHKDTTPCLQCKATRNHKMFNLWKASPVVGIKMRNWLHLIRHLAFLQSDRGQVYRGFQSNTLGRICS